MQGVQQLIGRDLNSEELAVLMSLVDVDGDGAIDLSEFTALGAVYRCWLADRAVSVTLYFRAGETAGCKH